MVLDPEYRPDFLGLKFSIISCYSIYLVVIHVWVALCPCSPICVVAPPN